MIYIHVPFCRSFCTYCDFYSEIACKGRDLDQFEAYTDSICREIESRRDDIEASSTPDTIYIGGGTPSVLPLSCLERIVKATGVRGADEFTIEVNPDDIVGKGIDYVAGLLDLGVNRVSMGVQSLDDGILRWMNRRHDAATAARAFGILRKAGVGNISVDVIFGLSHLDLSTLDGTLDGILSWNPEHVSAYQLSIEEGSALARMVEDGRYTEANEEQCRAQYELICRRLGEHGMHHYEISNWAVPGREAVHNSGYWKRLPYAGFGPGAHSFRGNGRKWNTQEISGWTSGSEQLSKEDERVEKIMLGLRTGQGVEKSICDSRAVRDLIEQGALIENGERIRIPESHFFTSEQIIRALL